MSKRNVTYIMNLRGNFNKNLKGANTAVSAMNKTTVKLSGILTSLAPTMGAISGIALFAKSIQTAMTFEKEMANVKAVSGATEMQFKSLQQQAESLGRTTVFSATQAAEGMKFLTMAGFNVKNTMSALPGVLDLAAAGTIDLGRAADIASNILTQFGLEAEKMNKVNDVIVATTTKTNTNVEQLAEGLKYVGTTAKILKIPLEETSAALGVMANAGLQGSMGGTSLNFALLEMARISSPTAKKLKALGVVTHNSTGQFVGLTNILEQFEKLGIKSTTILDTFGARGGRAMGTLVESGSDVIKNFTEINKSSEGIAKRIAKMKLDNLAGDMTLLKSASQGLSISFGKRMNPALRNVTKSATSLVNTLEKYVRIPLVQELRKEQVSLNSLLISLKDTNISEQTRSDIITEIQTKYPDLIGNIDLEKASNEELESAINKVNERMAEKIALAQMEDELAKQKEKSDKKEQKLINTQAELLGKLAALRIDVASNPLVDKSLLEDTKNNVELVNVLATMVEDLKEQGEMIPGARENLNNLLTNIDLLDKQFKKEENITKVLEDRVNAYKKILNIPSKKDDKSTISGVITTDKKADSLATTITSAAPKIINININKLIETQEINTNNLTEASPKIKEMITKILLEGINDTQINYKAS